MSGQEHRPTTRASVIRRAARGRGSRFRSPCLEPRLKEVAPRPRQTGTRKRQPQAPLGRPSCATSEPTEPPQKQPDPLLKLRPTPEGRRSRRADHQVLPSPFLDDRPSSPTQFTAPSRWAYAAPMLDLGGGSFSGRHCRARGDESERRVRPAAPRRGRRSEPPSSVDRPAGSYPVRRRSWYAGAVPWRWFPVSLSGRE